MTEYVSLIAFRVHEGREQDFVARFEAAGMLSRPRAIEGFIAGELIQHLEVRTRFAVVARWRTPGAYAAWQTVAQIGAPPGSLRMLAECIADTQPGELHRAL
jgi:heme-degrading monooxygenase HmoA